MSLVDDIPAGAVVGLDTAPLIYWLEDNPRHQPTLKPFFEDRLAHGLNTAVTSVVSLAEVLVQPLTLGRADLTQRYRDFFTAEPSLTLAAITPAVAEKAADLRARHRVRLPDAFQLAAALVHGASLFITNDLQLRRVTDLKVLILDDYPPPPPSTP